MWTRYKQQEPLGKQGQHCTSVIKEKTQLSHGQACQSVMLNRARTVSVGLLIHWRAVVSACGSVNTLMLPDLVADVLPTQPGPRTSADGS